MTSPFMNETDDPSLQIYGDQVIGIEKDSEIGRLKGEIEKLRQEVVNSNRNQQELTRKELDKLVSRIDDLSEKVESLSLEQPRNQVELAQEANNNSYSIDRLESLELQMKELMKALCGNINHRLEALEVNVTKIAVSNAENSQLKEEITASKLNQARIDEELSQKVKKLEQDLAVSKTENLRLSQKFENFDKNQTIHFKELSQKVKKFEQDLTASKTDNVKLEQNLLALSKNNFELINRFTSLEFELKEKIISALQLNANPGKTTQEKAQSENEIEIENSTGIVLQDVKKFRMEDASITQKVMGRQPAEALPNLFELRNRNNLIPDAQNVSQNENKVEKQSGGQRNTSVLILGGGGYLDTIYLLDLKAQSWKKLSITFPMEMYGLGAVVLNEEIYIFGGYAKNGSQEHCYKLKNDGSWIKLASLNQKRNAISSSSLVYKEDIWVIGGSSGEYLKSVEKYDISQDKWTYVPEMNYARYDAAAAVFKDRIFVTGGYNENKKKLKSVEMFDPNLQKWILFCDLPIEIARHTMLISNSTLSIFGGESEFELCDRLLNSVWEMDIEDSDKKWTEKQSFKHPRGSFGIGKLSNGIIVFGGCGGYGKPSEIFDGNEWIDGPELPQEPIFFAYTSIPRSLEERFLENFS